MTAKNPGYGRPGGDPKTSTMKLGSRGVDPMTHTGSKGIPPGAIPSGGAGGVKGGVEKLTDAGNKGTDAASTKAPTSKPVLD